MTFKQDLLKLAKAIADDASETDASGNAKPYGERIDALAELTKLYIAMQKHPDDADETSGEFSFEKGIQAPKEPTDESTIAFPAGRRRRPV